MPRRPTLLATLVLCTIILVTQPAGAQQDAAAARHQAVIDHLKAVNAGVSARSLTGVRTREQWEQRRDAARRELLYMLGLDPLPKRMPLEARVVGTLERPKYRIEKVVFQSLPRLYVTGNLYVPNDAPGPMPAVLYVCGHSPHPRGAKTEYQDRAVWFASHGYVCLVIDTLEFGEVPGLHHGVHDLNLFHWLSLGYTPAGVEVWNAVRAIDYLETRQEVDARRIGMTGTSGGGATTWFTAAVDERVAAAAPVCSTWTFGSQAAHWLAAGQCDCIYFNNTFLTDLPEVAALIAPRPLLICSGRKDGTFPPDGYREVYRRAKGVYDLYAGGDSDRLKEVDDDVGHLDSPLLRQAARQWMNHWLKGDPNPPPLEPSPEPRPEAPDDLACLAELPRDAINFEIHDRFIAAAKLEQPRTLDAWEARRAEMMGKLKDRCFRWFPREPAPFRARVTRNTGGWAARYAEYKEVLIESEPGVSVRLQVLRPKDRDRAGRAPLLVYAKRPGDSIYFMDWDELLPLMGRVNLVVLNARLTEHPVGAAEYAEIERTASWAGRTVAAMQVWDILRAVEWAVMEEGLPAGSVSLYGRGEMGVLAIYAGLLDERVGRVILKDPPASHWQGPALLNVLRITDTPEVAAAFAPRRLVFLRDIPAAFDYTRGVYALHGRPDDFARAGSLAEAMEAWKW